METINNIELKDESVYPDDDVLMKILGKTYNVYSRLLEYYDENGMEHTWRYYNDGKAWLCKVQKKKKTIVWMSAWKGFMKATVYFPEKNIDSVYKLDISKDSIDRIRSTKRVGKSVPCMFDIRNDRILKELDKVIQLKLGMK